MSASGITTSVVRCDEIAVLGVGGEIDVTSAPALETAIGAVLAHDPAALIIDLSNVDFLASAGLRILAATYEKVTASGRFAVVANSVATKRPIELTDLDQLFWVYPTLDEAVASFSDEMP